MSPVRIGLIGAGRIGASHARVIARRVPEATLVAVADPRPGAAAEVATPLGARDETSIEAILAADDVDAVVIAASSTAHAGLVIAAAEAGKHVFCEKPAGMSLGELHTARAATAAAGVAFQVGFNRRFAREFAAAHALITAGRLGTVRQLRSLTRDPGRGPADPDAVPEWTVFTQTLIHDFDALNWLNPGARAVDVVATAGSLTAPGHPTLLDHATVVIRYDNGAIATAEASFAAAYGYDVRGEVLGSEGMATMGDGAQSSLRIHDGAGRLATTSHSDAELLIDAYTGEFAEFAAAVQEGRDPSVTGDDAIAAFAIATACIDSMTSGTRADVAQGGPGMTFTLAVCAEMVYTDLPLVERVERLHSSGFAVEIWDWTTKDADALVATGARFTSMTGYVTGDLVTAAGADDLLSTAEESIAFARTLSCPSLNLHGTGLGEGGLPVVPVETVTGPMWVAAVRTLERIAALGERHDVTFVLENLNTDVDHPGTPFARAADTLALVSAVDSPHLRMNLDLYHAQIGEGNLVDLVRRAAPYLGEVQVADVPGRCEPGTGEVRWPVVARALADAGYDGVVAMEAFASEPGVAGSDVALDRFRDAFTV